MIRPRPVNEGEGRGGPQEIRPRPVTKGPGGQQGTRASQVLLLVCSGVVVVVVFLFFVDTHEIVVPCLLIKLIYFFLTHTHTHATHGLARSSGVSASKHKGHDIGRL